MALETVINTALDKTLRDAPLSDDTRVVETDGVLTLHAAVSDTWALHTWILWHAEHIGVVQPAVLRRELATRIRAAAARYA